ncbi:MAG: hypothetical protein WDN10_03945 [bacterium]
MPKPVTATVLFGALGQIGELVRGQTGADLNELLAAVVKPAHSSRLERVLAELSGLYSEIATTARIDPPKGGKACAVRIAIGGEDKTLMLVRFGDSGKNGRLRPGQIEEYGQKASLVPAPVEYRDALFAERPRLADDLGHDPRIPDGSFVAFVTEPLNGNPAGLINYFYSSLCSLKNSQGSVPTEISWHNWVAFVAAPSKEDV